MSDRRSSGTPEAPSDRARFFFGGLVAAWFIGLCLIPDPRPLGAPEWAVGLLRKVAGLSEPIARAGATIALRGLGLALIGVLLSLTFRRFPLKVAAPVVLVASPILAVAAQWINYGYFPIPMQLQLGLAAAVPGALLGLSLRRSRLALAALVVVAIGLFSFGTATGIPDDLHEAARATARYVLENADDVPKGDAGFARLLHLTFTYAEDNSHQTGAVFANRAAILALGVILGEELVVRVAKRRLDSSKLETANSLAGARKLRRRIRLRGRGDLSQHFWVSASLAVLSDDSRSMTVGITKEMMDAIPGGSGFSFSDLVADRAGTLFTVAATRDEESARAMQARIRNGVVIDQYCPNVEELPDGIPRDEFQQEYGGLGGVRTKKIVAEIRKRLATCEALK